ncbi:MAG: hypothetical protein IJU68_03415 [Bacteroidales bacterium]|nr:hypothetical protein [Bacteroidales bacterium]
MKSLSFSDKEFLCQQIFDSHGPYWHVATPGASTEILFTSADDYRFGVTLMAESLYCCGVKTYSFSLMSNHLHNIAETREKQNCIDFLEHFASRLRRYSSEFKRNLDLSGFVCDPLPIDNLQSLRNNIVYVDRNQYVVNAAQTPYSNPWGSGFLYFGYSPSVIASTPFNSLSVRAKRNLSHSRNAEYPDYFTVRNGFIAPESFVDWKTGKSFFRDAHQYFNLLTKNREAYSEFAALYGDKFVLTDEEMYSAAVSLALKIFNVNQLNDLSDQQRKELARKMHFDYRAGNSQIHRILKLDKHWLKEVFPEAR